MEKIKTFNIIEYINEEGEKVEEYYPFNKNSFKEENYKEKNIKLIQKYEIDLNLNHLILAFNRYSNQINDYELINLFSSAIYYHNIKLAKKIFWEKVIKHNFF